MASNDATLTLVEKYILIYFLSSLPWIGQYYSVATTNPICHGL